MSAADREASFHYKRLGQRAAIVAAGPLANFVFAIVVLAILFMTYGEPFTPAEVGQVTAGSAAATAGVQVGDVITRIDDHAIQRFEDVQQIVRLNPDQQMTIVLQRDGNPITLQITPTKSEFTDRFGNTHRIGLLGIGHSERRLRPPRPADRGGAVGDRDLEHGGGNLSGDVSDRDRRPR